MPFHFTVKFRLVFCMNFCFWSVVSYQYLLCCRNFNVFFVSWKCGCMNILEALVQFVKVDWSHTISLNLKMVKKRPEAPHACVLAGNWFRHVAAASGPVVLAHSKSSDEKVQLPPIFAHRNRRNYRESNQFSQFDNRWDHEKKKRINPELTLRHNYESPEIIVSSLPSSGKKQN